MNYTKCIEETDFRELVKTLRPTKHLNFLREDLKPNLNAYKGNLKVGIIGAGFAGLYAALILDSLGIDFELIEANKEHIGGRAFTYYFGNLGKKANTTCREFYDYAEMGPMRLPSVDTRVVGDVHWSLVNYLKNHKSVQHKPKLIKFYFSNENTFYYFNGRKIYFSDSQCNDPLHFGDSYNGGVGTGVPDNFAARPYSTWIDLAIRPFLDLIQVDPQKSFRFLKKYDADSFRTYLANFDAKNVYSSMGLPFNVTSPIAHNYSQMVINWLETMDSGTNLYEAAFSDNVLEAFKFGSTKWLTIDGGISRLVDSMAEALSLDEGRIKMGAHVTRISKVFNSTRLKVTVKDGSSFDYDHVISTMPLGPLQNVDTKSLNLSLKKRMAIRMLSYESSVKIAFKFRTRWWQDPVKMNNKPIIGGQTFTDLPIRKIIYPSHGVECANATGTILVSYTWGQDAIRIGSTVRPKTPSQNISMNENELVEEVLHQLGLIHGKIVRQEYTGDYFVMNWNGNPLSRGAYSFFGPGQFSTLYPSMIKAEADGHLHFAGEALSVHHGWIQGALDSAYRTVMEILIKQNMTDNLRRLKEIWGQVDELAFFN